VALRTDFLDANRVKVLQSHRGASFDLGLSSVTEDGIPSGQVALVDLRFSAPGEYTVTIHRVNGYGMDRQRINLGNIPKKIIVK
jgi:hypothetical protein